MEQPTASQVILTNTAFMLEEQLKESELENKELGTQLEKLLELHKNLRDKYKILCNENLKLKSKFESMENYAKELGEGIFKAEVSE